jgi:NADPH:quinone reductase-like Zn-dependent oxidoreductase
MRALVMKRAGGPEVLEVQEGPELTPAIGEVRVRVARAGLNFTDLAARVGLYPDAPPFPLVSGYEVSGTVDALGPDTPGFAVGDQVVAMTRFGGQASQVVVPVAQVRRIPAGVSLDEAAAIPVNYLTAYHLLFHLAPLQPGMTVLIHMAAGGVGLAALQLCRTVPGVKVFGTASVGKHDFLRSRGLDHPLDSRRVDYPQVVRSLTHGRGVHRVLDPLGGPDWARGAALLRPGGHLLCYGWANMISGQRLNPFTVAAQFLRMKRFSPLELMDHNRSVSGTNMGRLWSELELLGRHFDALMELAREGVVKPHVDSVYPLARAAEAHAHLQGRRSLGKVLLDCEAAPKGSLTPA